MSVICHNCFREKQTEYAACPHCGYDASADEEMYPLALPAGSILNGRYIIGRVLGQGGFGITYIAQDIATGQRIAIKEFFPETMATRISGHTVKALSKQRNDNFSYGMECFLDEAKTLAQFIGVESIIQVYSYFEENGTAYFAMDYVDGVSFQTFLRQRGGKIKWDEALGILIPVMDALSVVHSKGIVHRDIAPDNIYISRDGTVKLLDFGAARDSIGDQSRSLDVVLKAGYAPKEQYTRRGRQGAYTDVYSMAATYYYAITGHLPPESIERTEDDVLIPPSSYGIRIPEEIEAALEKGLAVRYVDRYQTMTEFRQALTSSRRPIVPPKINIDDIGGIQIGRHKVNPVRKKLIALMKEQELAAAEWVQKVQNAAGEYGQKIASQISGAGQVSAKWIEENRKAQRDEKKAAAENRNSARTLPPKAATSSLQMEGSESQTRTEHKNSDSKRRWTVIAAVACIAAVVTIVLGMRTFSVPQRMVAVNTAPSEQSTAAETTEAVEQETMAAGNAISVLPNEVALPGETELVRNTFQFKPQTIAAGSNSTMAVEKDGSLTASGEITGTMGFFALSRLNNAENIISVYSGDDFFLALRKNGTVKAVGNNEHGQCNVSDWTDVVDIAVGEAHTVGLKSDGTVVAAGLNEDGQCNVTDWTDIVAISAGDEHTVGLRTDGTVVAVGNNAGGQCDVSAWKGIVSIGTGYDHTVGLKTNGTVAVTGAVSTYAWETDYVEEISQWENIATIFSGAGHIVAIQEDGTVVSASTTTFLQADASDWEGIKDIVKVSISESHIVGLRADGSVVASGEDYWINGNTGEKKGYGELNVSDWGSIVDISAGHTFTVGLKADGTTVAVGNNEDGQCDVSSWKNIMLPSPSTISSSKPSIDFGTIPGGSLDPAISTDSSIDLGEIPGGTTPNTWAVQSQTIAAANGTVFAVKSDGTVLTDGYSLHGACDVSDWRDIVSIVPGGVHTVGLKADGTVVATGYNEDGRCNVSDWHDVVMASAGYLTAGLKEDGTVVFAGSNASNAIDVSGWNQVVKIAADRHIVGLRADGTVVATGCNSNGECDVSEWRNIVDIAIGEKHTVGLKSNGTVVATGENKWGECDVSDWTDVCAVVAQEGYTLGLRKDGTVLSAGCYSVSENHSPQKVNVSAWGDISAIVGGGSYAAGLRKDGTVVYSTFYDVKENRTSDWENIVAIAGGFSDFIGLNAEGNAVVCSPVGNQDYDLSSWTDIRIPDLRT